MRLDRQFHRPELRHNRPAPRPIGNTNGVGWIDELPLPIGNARAREKGCQVFWTIEMRKGVAEARVEDSSSAAASVTRASR